MNKDNIFEKLHIAVTTLATVLLVYWCLDKTPPEAMIDAFVYATIAWVILELFVFICRIIRRTTNHER